LKVLAHPDPVVLERELLDRVEAAHPPGGTARTLIVVPTVRLAEHVQRRLTERRAAWLGVEVLHFAALGRRILADSHSGEPRVLPGRLFDALLVRVLTGSSGNRWADFARRRPGALRQLSRVVRDLREARIEPGDLAAQARGELQEGLARIYDAFLRELERVGRSGWVDASGLIRLASRGAEKFAASFGAVFLYGAYELIGAHLDLVRALDRGTGVVALIPAGQDLAVSRYAHRYAERHLLDGNPPEWLEADDADREQRLTALYDEGSMPDPAPAGRFDFWHAQGELSEIQLAVRSAMAAVRGGCAPHEIAIVGRNLDAYAPALEQVLDDEGLPWTSSVSTPLRRHPLARDLLLMLRVAEDDFPRAPTVELLRSPRIVWKSLVRGVDRPNGGRADTMSRGARILGGLEEWTEELFAWAAEPRSRAGATEERRREDRERAAERATIADGIGRALNALRERLDPETERGWENFASDLADLLETTLRRADDAGSRAAREALHGLLEEMRGMSEVLGDSSTIPLARARAWLEEAIDGCRLAPRRADDDGLRVLDLMQMRGLTFDHVFFVGMNSGLFPRVPREDPLLPDDLRRRLVESTGRPLVVRAEGLEEERLLLSLLTGSARTKICISWQRADETGKARTPSPALRELARVSHGRPDADLLLEKPEGRISTHPLHRLEQIEERAGLLSPAEERLLAALQAKGPEPRILRERYPELASGLDALCATEAFDPRIGRYDARDVAVAAVEGYSVSALDTLGNCPLRFFFRHVLRARELDEGADALQVPSKEMGLLIHDLLQRVYETLHAEGRFDVDGPEQRTERALELLEEAWTEAAGALGRRLARRLPVLWERHRERWLDLLRRFVREDLRRLNESGWRPAGFEEDARGELDLGDERRLVVRGRFDRRFVRDDGVLIGDYKTSRHLKDRVNPLYMLRGRQLQVPLYAVLAAGVTSVELLGIEPRLDYDEPDPKKAGRRVVFDRFDDLQARGFEETLQVLLELVRSGSFPFRKDTHCDWCPYTQACRRTHLPTIDRQEATKIYEPFRRLATKSNRAPLLSMVQDD
jgi:ATP-dependent helicase/nuclease subunit B